MKRIIVLIGLVSVLVPTLCFAKNFKDTSHIPVLEYHSVSAAEARWARSIENFKKDLLWLYNNDYYPVAASSFARMSFQIPKGKKPVVITFDDGSENQFRYLENGEIDPSCAVGIMDAFYNEHPDFSRAAVFYVNSVPFGKKTEVSKKLQYLLDTGREIGNHTLNHADLSKADPYSELGGLVKKLSEYTGFSFPVRTVAYPHGFIPKNEQAVKNGSFEGYFYMNEVGFLVGAEPSLLPTDGNFDSLRVPRIQAIDDEWKRWFNRPSADFVDKAGNENFKPFVYGEEKVYPYNLCGDPDASQYILRKKVGVSFSSLKSFLLSLFIGKPETPHPRGIYLNTGSVTSNAGRELVEKLVASGGNMVVFDILPAGRLVPYPGEEAVNEKYIQQVKDFIAFLNEKKVYTIARYVLFKNPTLAAYRPGWLLKSKASGGIWSGDGGPVWLDPSMPEVQDYVIGAAKKIAELGISEIQFDYVRFPTASNSKDTSYYAVRTAKGDIPNKWMALRDFLKRMRNELAPYEVKIGVDFYGIVAWNDGFDAYSTGQKIECLAPYVDVIYPMAYPSHFGPGFGGHTNPADEPYYFVKKTSELFLNYMQGTDTLLRPWLQGFAMRVTNYNSSYVPEQYRALKDLGVYEFAVWNASNIYDLHWGAFK